MNEGEMSRRLTAGNRWWQDPKGWARTDRDMKRLRDNPLPYAPGVLDDLAPGGLYVLYGPRRVGKSAVVKRRIDGLLAERVHPRRIIHFACDELGRGDLQRLGKVARDTLTRSVDEPRYWLLDEITSVSDWPVAIKWLRDNTAMDDDTVVLTGSSVKGLAEARKELAGRRGPAEDSDRILYPMSFRSLCRCLELTVPLDAPVIHASQFQERAGEDAVDALLPWLDDLLVAWEIYLTVGGFPRAVGDHIASGGVSRPFVNGLWDVIHGDALKTADLAPTQTQALLLRVSKNLASPTAVSSLANDMGLGSHHTAQARVNDLISAGLVWPCHQEGPHRAPHLAAQSKLYFIDPLLARLAHLRDDHLPAPDPSRLSEQQIGAALLRVLQPPASSAGEYAAVMYRKTKTKEVDFVGPSIGATGFESKYVDSGWRSEARTVMSQYGRGVVATRAALDLTGPVWAVPAPIVAYLLNGL